MLVSKDNLFRSILNHIRHCPCRLGREILYKYMVLPRGIYGCRRYQSHCCFVRDDCGTPWICTHWTKDLNRTHLDITCRESTTLIASTTHEGYRADFIVTLDELSINFGTE